MVSHRDRYVIVELNGSGHRFWYVSLLILWLETNVAASEIYLVTTQSARNKPEWTEFLENRPHAGLLHVVFAEGPRATLDVIAPLLRVARTRLVIPDGDGWLMPLVAGTLRHSLRPRGSMLIMRPYRRPGPGGAFSHLTKLALVFSMAITMRDFRVLRLAPAGSSETHRGWVNDPVAFNPQQITRGAWYDRLGLALDQRYLVVLGDLSQRKFVRELMDAFHQYPVGDWHLILAGRLDTSGQIHFASLSSPRRICLTEGFLSDEDFDTWIAQADAVAVLHRNEGASGILGKCLAAGVPVLVGGAQSVLDSARLLDLPRSEIRAVNASTICKALDSLPLRGDVVCHGPITAGSDEFSSRLLRD